MSKFDASIDAPYDPLDVTIGGKSYKVTVTLPIWRKANVAILQKNGEEAIPDYVAALALYLNEDQEVVNQWPVNQVLACITWIQQQLGPMLNPGKVVDVQQLKNEKASASKS